MDQQILDNARMGVWLLNDQTGPDAQPDAARTARALNKLITLGKAIDAEHLSEHEAAALVRNVCSPLRKAEEKEV